MNRILRHPYIPMLIFLTAVLAALYLVSQKYSFFWIFPFLDKILHVVGGVVVGFLAIILADFFVPRASLAKKFLIIALGALVLGIAVEVGEYFLNIYSTAPLAFDGADVASDLVYDTLGGVIAFAYYFFNPPTHDHQVL